MTRGEFISLLASSRNIESLIDTLFKKELVPPSGPAETVAGEIIRALGRIGYRYHNDGDYFYDGYGLETVAPSVAYLLDVIEKYGDVDDLSEAQDILEGISARALEDDNYYNEMKKFFSECLDLLRSSDIDLFIEENTDDSRNYDASIIIENRPLYDYDLYVPDEVMNILDNHRAGVDDLISYVKEIIDMNFSNTNDVEFHFNQWAPSITIMNLNSDQLNEVKSWNEESWWHDFIDEYKGDNDLEESFNQEYLDRCKKVKEDYMKFNLNKKELKEGFTEEDLDDDAARRCCFKYNCGRRQLMDMLKEVI